MIALGLDGIERLDGVIPLAAALLCGALIGWDRESEGRAAGLRTHMMVSLGAAGFTLTAMRMAESAAVDPARVVGAAIGGVGFLGAGSIIKSGGRVRGLTTAAGMWVVAAIGIACGLGHYDTAVFMSVFAIGTLTVMRRLEPPARATGDTSEASR